MTYDARDTQIVLSTRQWRTTSQKQRRGVGAPQLSHLVTFVASVRHMAVRETHLDADIIKSMSRLENYLRKQLQTGII